MQDEVTPKPRRGRPPKSQSQSTSTDQVADLDQVWPEPSFADAVATSGVVPANGAFKKTPKDIAASAKKLERVYAKQQELDHDLFRLKIATFTRNASYNENNPIYEHIEHTHFYHSIDSRGRRMDFSSKVGGHFHRVEIKPDGSAVCGPPVHEVKVKKHGRISTEYRTNGFDNHTHEVEYRFSEKIRPTTPNVEFAKVQSKVADAQVKRESVRIDDVIDEG
jgi:hypothetical protein